MIFSTGDCYTIREIEPGLFEYVIGACANIEDPVCLCACGIAFAYVEGLTESHTCCYFCSQRRRRARLASAPLPPESEP